MRLSRVSGWRAAVGAMLWAGFGEERLRIGLFSKEASRPFENGNGTLSHL